MPAAVARPPGALYVIGQSRRVEEAASAAAPANLRAHAIDDPEQPVQELGRDGVPRPVVAIDPGALTPAVIGRLRRALSARPDGAAVPVLLLDAGAAQPRALEDPHGVFELAACAAADAPPAREPVDLAALVDANGGAVAPDAPVRVLGTHAQVEEIVRAVLSAAECLTGPPGVAVSLATAPPEALLRVRLGAPGLACDTLARLFDPLSAVGQSVVGREGAIGLHLARRLAEVHGGRLEARAAGDASTGAGGELVLALPLAAGADAPPRDRTGPLRVLLVEDNDDIRETLQEILALHGYAVDCAADGESGLARLQAFGPDVAIVDIGLPVIDGYTFASCARALQMAHRPTLIAVTGYGRPEDRQRAREAGFDGHLIKPVDVDLLLKKLVEASAARAA